jgi:hypothetical protein
VLQVENELTKICNSILSLLDDNLIPSATTGESKARGAAPAACRGALAAHAGSLHAARVVARPAAPPAGRQPRAADRRPRPAVGRPLARR